MNQNNQKYITKSNQYISLKTQKIPKKNFNLKNARSPNFNSNAFTNYIEKKAKKKIDIINNNNNNINNNNKNVKKTKNKYSAFVSMKKKQLERTQSHLNQVNKISKIKLDKTKKENNTVLYLDNQTQNYHTNQPTYINYQNYKNIDLNIDIDPRQEYDDLIYDQIEEFNSQQKYLTDDENLISKFKGLTKDNQGREICKPVIENIIQSKKNYLNQLKDNIVEYQKLLTKYK